MTLCINRMVHTMSHPGSSTFGISIDDIRSWGEQERLESGRRSRSHTLDEILSTTFYRTPSRGTTASSGLSRPVSAAMTLPTMSRPSSVNSNRPSGNPNNTAISHPINRAVVCTSAPPDLPSSTLAINRCLRSQSAKDRTMSGLVGCLARQCCDVLGPPVCNQCAKLKRRDDNMEDSENTFPNLQISEDNFAKSVLINTYLPDMTPYQVQTKIARGEIALDSFRNRLQKRRLNAKTNAKAIEPSVPNQVFRPKSRNTTETGATDTFFTSIQHLNHKIVSGQMDRKLNPSPKQSRNSHQRHGTEDLVPVFVSPRKHRYQQPSYKTFYDPPLLPRANQNPAPSFFAGGNDEYILPDRLPEVIVFEGGEIASVEALDPPKTTYDGNETQDNEMSTQHTECNS